MKFFLDALDQKNIDLDQINIESITGVFLEKAVQSDSDLVYHIEDNDIYHAGSKIGKILDISTPDQMSQALESGFSVDLLVIKTSSWHIIPLENLAAKFQKLNTRLFAYASTLEEIKLLENILEIGIDGCVIPFKNKAVIDEYLQKDNKEALQLQEFDVAAVKKIEIGDRVCVDTCSMLRLGEGLLVGSTSNLFILVQAEVEESGFVSARPFRINAGVVASYVLNYEKTNYLSELHAGKSVMIVNQNGMRKTEAIARVKIERRPMILLEMKHDERTYPVILQDAETVKVIHKSGSISVTEVKIGDKLLGLTLNKARHFGMQVTEFIEEK